MPARSFGAKTNDAVVMDVQVLQDQQGVRLRRVDATTYTTLLTSSTSPGVMYTGILGINDGDVVLDGDVRPGTVLVTAGGVTAQDDGDGTIVGTGVASPSTIDYEDGDITVTLVDAFTGPVLVTFKTFKLGAFDETGEYVAGDITFPNWRAEGITELFGFNAHEVHRIDQTVVGQNPKTGDDLVVNELDDDDLTVNLTSILYQLSVDDGTTWQYFRSGAWTESANDINEEFSDWVEIDQGIGSLTFDAASGYKQLRVKARLVPSDDGRWTPLLKYVTVLHELTFDPEADFKRSIKRFFDDDLRVRETLVLRLKGAQATVTLSCSEGDQAQKDDITYDDDGLLVYNLSDDAGRTTNVGGTIAGNVLTFTTPQIGTIEVQVMASIPTFVGRADDRVIQTTSRAVVVMLSGWRERPEFDSWPRGVNSGYYELEFSALKVRQRNSGNLLGFDTLVVSQSPKDLQCSAVAAAVRRLLDSSQGFVSVATGAQYVVADQADLTGWDDVNRGLSAAKQTCTFMLWAQEGTYNLVDLVQDIQIKMMGSVPGELGKVPGAATGAFDPVDSLLVQNDEAL